MAPGAAHHDHDEHRAHGELGDGRPDAGPGDPEPCPVDEDDVENCVERRAARGDPQRRPGVLHAPQHAGGREDEEHPGEPERGPAEVDDGVLGDLARAAHRADGPRRRRPQDGCEERTQPDGEPEAVDPGLERLPRVAGADAARDGGRGRVGEEDAQADEGHEEGRREGEARELRGAEMADDGAVDEHEQRLGHERAERGHGEGQDLPVEPGPCAATCGRRIGAGRRPGVVGVAGRCPACRRRVARLSFFHTPEGSDEAGQRPLTAMYTGRS
ncbi:Uncharacterised protein [Mycobacteroides abscessus]|nr:Uncharacterised protein [Mycobacteroides abscessus]